jgi:uncharacterized protein YeaO (DUF488 family)
MQEIRAGVFEPNGHRPAHMPRIRTKRIYEPAAPDDRFRVLADRLWPRGLTKELARVDLWLRELAPSTELRKWFQHDPASWDEFRRRYFAELDGKPELVGEILEQVRWEPITLVFSSQEARYNNAIALKEYLEKRVVEE